VTELVSYHTDVPLKGEILSFRSYVRNIKTRIRQLAIDKLSHMIIVHGHNKTHETKVLVKDTCG